MPLDVVSYALAKKKVSWSDVKKKLEDTVNKNVDIRRLQLEYPTENVTFAYLAIIGKTTWGWTNPSWRPVYLVTIDSFTDKAVRLFFANNGDAWGGQVRYQDQDNTYYHMFQLGATTADHQLRIRQAATETIIASEAVDLTTGYYDAVVSMSGSTIKGSRDGGSTFPISATDTTFTSGAYGTVIGEARDGAEQISDAFSSKLLAPLSPLSKALRIFEIDIIEEVDQTLNIKTIKPNFTNNLVEVATLTNLPDFLQQEAKRYEILKAKGFTDEEIEALLGYIPQHQVDLNSITWGAFDYKGEPTMLCVVTGDNPYKQGAILEQESYVKSKNLKVFKPPRDLLEARQLYAQIKADRPEIIAGVHNLAYQCIGAEELEYLAVADFYDGFTQGIYNAKDLKNVPDWELRKTIERWKDRLKRVTIAKLDAERHLKKLEEFEKSGW